jgi:ion channel-forming bestrophin family protein
MYIKRHLNFLLIYFFTWRLMLFSLLTGTAAVLIYQYLDWKWVAIPWLPVSLIGTAVAFYVGFKNNQAYDRSWEARKIWGCINNLSRSFTASLRAYTTGEYADKPIPQHRIDEAIKTVTYRHIAWLYALRHAMWQRTPWEHQRRINTWYRNYFEKSFAYGTFEDELSPFLSAEEHKWIKTRKNAPAQLLDRQSQHLKTLRAEGFIDSFQQIELQKLITDLYAEQGKSERIKNTPLPRQYATSSTLFIIIFTLLLPFGMITEFQKLGDSMLWLLVPFNLIVSWIFSLMEYIGDYSENPFEGLINDVPVLTIVRNIEIDLKDMLGEKDLPEKIKPVHDVLL